ncbi:TRAFAC clade GTPase domain-containing protein [Aeromonas rivipollensis]|uniref:TRAFAC clade GTPase domain-containing protein n=1 Tax=Aeromonas rivipollensis TaxID=948519 RepID=UPI003D227FE8
MMLIIVITSLTGMISTLELNPFDSRYTSIAISAVSVVMGIYVSFIFKFLKKNPTPFRAFIIGQPRTGKTVYLSVLFDELQRHYSNRVDFQPSGSETVEKVNSNLNCLRKGSWLPSTEVNTAFYFRARASIGTGFFKQYYTVEVGDYAGEHIDEFDASSDMWLHKTDYFKYALSSDALMFCIDGSILCSNDIEKIENSQSMLIGAYQMLLTETQSKAGEGLKIPVALLLLKSDLFNFDMEGLDLLRTKYARLITLMEKKSKYFEIFSVSSVGETVDGMPPKQMNPHNVCQPMLWLLSKSKA